MVGGVLILVYKVVVIGNQDDLPRKPMQVILAE